MSKEDFNDVVGLLPPGTPLPASDKMTYLLARLEVSSTDLLWHVLWYVSQSSYALVHSHDPLSVFNGAPQTASFTSSSNMESVLQRVATGDVSMTDAVGPAVGCLMATFGTNMIPSCIFAFSDPEDLS